MVYTDRYKILSVLLIRNKKTRLSCRKRDIISQCDFPPALLYGIELFKSFFDVTITIIFRKLLRNGNMTAYFLQEAHLITPATKYINLWWSDAANTGFAQILFTCLIAAVITPIIP